ncbi:protein WALLS ARE THIN 1-like [Salvia splendens]|uniref:protein WALLS ARE THIN 1-like n=1 Tax=Salvia splendens TaxID=180675 RepID=UPI001C266DD2|nr:protein WALLS ARE THIN 1-like [Salvia splendens]
MYTHQCVFCQENQDDSQVLVASGIAFAVQIWCIDKGGPVFVAVYQPVQTLVVAITSSLLLGEEFYLGGIIGAVMIIFGLYLVVWGKSEEKKKKKFAEIQRRAEHNTPQIRTCITQPLLAQSFDYG